MRHGKSGKKFGRDKAGRKALMRNLAKQLFIYGRIVTTVEKGKYLRTIAEPIITRAKRGTLKDLREVAKYIDHKDILKKIFKEVAPLFKGRNGGYMRVLRLGNRPGDNAEKAVVELIGCESIYKRDEAKKEDKAKKEPAEQKPAKEAQKGKTAKEEKKEKKEDRKPVKK